MSYQYPSSLTLNSCFVLVLLLLILYLSILDFIRFALKSVRYTMYITAKCEFLPLVSIKMLTLKKATNNSSCVKIIKKNITQSNNTFGTGSVCLIIFRFGI